MSAPRSRKEAMIYRRYRADKNGVSCEFCNIQKNSPQFISETEYFKIIRNIFAYSLWDGQTVSEHLMLVPKKHIDSLANLPRSAAAEYVQIISKYEGKGYNLYARAPVSIVKSVPHQHTHLIKTSGKLRRFIFLLMKPYIRVVR